MAHPNNLQRAGREMVRAQVGLRKIMANPDGRGRLDRSCGFLSRHGPAVLCLILLITGILGTGAFRIRGEVLLQEMFPYDHPYLKLHARFCQVFGGGGSGVAIALRARKGDIFHPAILDRLQRMTNEIALWDEVYRPLTVSLASRSVKVVKARGKGEITIAPLMWPEVPQTSQEMARLKQEVFSDPAYAGTLVSRDGTAALILTELQENLSYERAFELLQGLVRRYSDGETSVHIVGYPMLMGWIYSDRAQICTVFAISLGLMLLVLLLLFRSGMGLIAPLVNTAILSLWGLGWIGWSGINFSPLLYILAFLVGARMVSNAVQITCRYLEELSASGQDRLRACHQTLRAMLVPNLAAVTTDAAGFLVLLLAKIVLMRQLALIMGLWMLSLALTGLLVPLLCRWLPLEAASERWARGRCRTDGPARAILRVARFSLGPGRVGVIVLLLGLGGLCGWQMGKLKVGDPTPGSPLLWPDQTYNRDQALINRLFDASSEDLRLFYQGPPGSVYDPRVLTTFEAFDRSMKERLPDLYRSSDSVIDLVRRVNLTLHDGDPLWEQLPRNMPMLTGLMGYVKQNTDLATLGRFVDRTLERAQITLFFSDHTSESLRRIHQAAHDFFRAHPGKVAGGEFQWAGGRIGMEMGLNEEMRRAHLLIDAAVLAAIFLLCALFYRSIVAGLLLTLPLILANSVAFAYMAWAGIGLSIHTLPVAAIGVGVGVDFAIYLYSRCLEEASLQGDRREALLQAVCTAGKAVAYTGLTVILPILPWYFLSDLKFQAQMGLFLAMVLGTNVLLTFTLHPWLIDLLKPKFIFDHFPPTGRSER